MAKLWDIKGGKSSGGEDKTAGSGVAESGEGTARQVEAFTVGNDYLLDRTLLPYDIRASKVHAGALKSAGILTGKEYAALVSGLEEIYDLHEKGEFEILPEHEDGHTAIELWLTEKLGDLGKKIHTGRSRNDQVLTAVRLYEKDQLGRSLQSLHRFTSLLVSVGEKHADIPMPGYTHTRKAMLSSVGQWTGGYAELLVMQLETSAGCRVLVNSSPLGTAAGFGSSLGLDRDTEASELGFAMPMACATTAQLSRGWVEWQLVNWLSAVTLVLGRMAEDIILFSGESYGFFTLDAAVCTGSSIMPQKKNPDVAELIRAKHAHMEGYAATLQGVIRNLGSGYHRDLQLTKEPVIRAFETARELLDASELLINHLSFDSDKLDAACTADLQAAEAAYKLVTEKGLSFRDAYMKIKTDLESGEADALNMQMSDYTQLGSPGNPGLDRLKKRLDAWSEKRET